MIPPGYLTDSLGALWYRHPAFPQTPPHFLAHTDSLTDRIALSGAHAARLAACTPEPGDLPPAYIARRHRQWRRIALDPATGKRGAVSYHATQRDAISGANPV